jgi:hypothetical protein
MDIVPVVVKEWEQVEDLRWAFKQKEGSGIGQERAPDMVNTPGRDHDCGANMHAEGLDPGVPRRTVGGNLGREGTVV